MSVHVVRGDDPAFDDCGYFDIDTVLRPGYGLTRGSFSFRTSDHNPMWARFVSHRAMALSPRNAGAPGLPIYANASCRVSEDGTPAQAANLTVAQDQHESTPDWTSFDGPFQSPNETDEVASANRKQSRR